MGIHPKRPKGKAKELTGKWPESIGEALGAFTKGSDMSVAITGAAFVEKGLEDLLRSHFVPLDKETTRVFSMGDPAAFLAGSRRKYVSPSPVISLETRHTRICTC